MSRDVPAGVQVSVNHSAKHWGQELHTLIDYPTTMDCWKWFAETFVSYISINFLICCYFICFKSGHVSGNFAGYVIKFHVIVFMIVEELVVLQARQCFDIERIARELNILI